MERDEKIVDILMDDDEIEIMGEVEKERVMEEKKERDLVSEIPYRNVTIDIGMDIRLRVLDIAIVIVAIILAYMLYIELM